MISDDPRLESLRNRLSSSPYDRRAFELVRFRDDPHDDVVHGLVSAAIALDAKARDSLRSGLDDESLETLRLFAIRRMVQARRRASAYLVDEAIDGYALLTNVADVPWETWLKATLCIARFLGRDLDSLGRRFTGAASAPAGGRFAVAVESMNRVEGLMQCHVAEVSTSYGTGFVETIVVRDTTYYGAIYGPPPQADNVVQYRPTTNLAQLAVSLADALDATGDLRTGPIVHAELAALYFSLVVPTSYVSTNGCLSFYVDATASDQTFTVFVAELTDDVDPTSLATSVDPEGQACVVDDRRLVLLTSPPSFEVGAEDVVDLGRFAELARQALIDTAASRWMAR